MSNTNARIPIPILAGIVLAILVGFGLVIFAVVALLLPARPAQPVEPPVPSVEPRDITFPTATPIPTQEPPTATPTVTPSPAPTEGATATATAPQAPQSTRPPATAIPPTNTAAPTAPPASADWGLTNVTFSVDNPTVGANQRIQFRFSVATGGTKGEVVFGYLGVAIIDANGQNVGYHTSWTGWKLAVNEKMDWVDGLTIGTPGTYHLQLSGCFPSVDACAGGTGTWVTLAAPVTVTVN